MCNVKFQSFNVNTISAILLYLIHDCNNTSSECSDKPRLVSNQLPHLTAVIGDNDVKFWGATYANPPINFQEASPKRKNWLYRNILNLYHTKYKSYVLFWLSSNGFVLAR